MKFKKASILFDDDRPIYFTEDSPPTYLISKEYNWWWEGYIKKLAVGEYIDSDFHRYTRVE